MSKFDEILKQLEESGVKGDAPEAPDPGAKASMVDAYADGLMKLVKLAKGPKASASQQIAANPSVLDSLAAENATVMVVMPPAKVTNWLVQVYPDDAGVLHYQAKSTPSTSYYTKWYDPTAAPEVYAAVQAVYNASSSDQRRKSFYASSEKQYLICSRISDTEVEIPGGVGTISLPGLFAKD